MASDNKKAKADPAPKKEAAAKTKSTSGEDVSKADLTPKNEAVAKDKSTAGEDVSKPDGGATGTAAPSNYSRGEGQKPVTKAYKDNWNAIFAKKNVKKKKR